MKLIEKEKAKQTPPKVMEELWAIEHSYFVNRYATVKAILDLYAK